MDCISCDIGQSWDMGTHLALFERNLICMENIAHLAKIPQNGATVSEESQKIVCFCIIFVLEQERGKENL